MWTKIGKHRFILLPTVSATVTIDATAAKVVMCPYHRARISLQSEVVEI